MRDFLKLSATDLAAALAAGTYTSEQVTQGFLDRIATFDERVNAFVTVDAEGALSVARAVDADRAKGVELPRFAGVPIAIKDNIVIRGMETTCSSRILKGWRPPYDATVIEKIKAERMPILGHTNMDEFAMGSSTEHSCYGPTRNPWDLDRIPGGSSGGSAAAVAAFFTPWALGTDTGGSIRQPASVNGIVGAKPTYGYVSRYGAVAMASSLDQIGPFARTVADAAALEALIGGKDPLDSTSLPDPIPDYAVELGKGIENMKIGNLLPTFDEAAFEPGVLDAYKSTLEQLSAAGAEVIDIKMRYFDYALPAYYLIMPAEVSSNLARFDGIRYGIRVVPESGPVTSETVMASTRGAGFGDEVKRRIILGTHVLSAGYFDAYYGSAQKVRTLVLQDYSEAFAKVDALVSPTSPTVAFPLGARLEDPMSMYAADIATIPPNLAGLPAVSIPIGLSQNLPVGFQITTPQRADALMYRVAAAVENQIGVNIAENCPAVEWEEK
ncbi:MAG: Asp-tRNA(Asn)/Glu-tRNA(Gln) amidotransferase subunit GatA [Varibaculum sp.]|nr:Asp-tRNA(Asn)/Glu-tRNA(Gln) amidotransferase subunit GatA [Varibaculum sp.]